MIFFSILVDDIALVHEQLDEIPCDYEKIQNGYKSKIVWIVHDTGNANTVRRHLGIFGGIIT